MESSDVNQREIPIFFRLENATLKKRIFKMKSMKRIEIENEEFS